MHRPCCGQTPETRTNSISTGTGSPARPARRPTTGSWCRGDAMTALPAVAVLLLAALALAGLTRLGWQLLPLVYKVRGWDR